MATFISISGPSTTGKSSLVNALSTYKEMSNAIMSPDIHDAVWSDLVRRGFFSEFSEILRDGDYFNTYISKIIDYYTDYILSHKDSDALVVLDGCWLDLSIYTILNMWYNRTLKPLQEQLLSKIAEYDSLIDRIYITQVDDIAYPTPKGRLRGKATTFRDNRSLETKYYDIAKHLNNSIAIPSSDISEASLFILEDLRNLGYL